MFEQKEYDYYLVVFLKELFEEMNRYTQPARNVDIEEKVLSNGLLKKLSVA
jgi:hypothetical protein